MKCEKRRKTGNTFSSTFGLDWQIQCTQFWHVKNQMFGSSYKIWMVFTSFLSYWAIKSYDFDLFLTCFWHDFGIYIRQEMVFLPLKVVKIACFWPIFDLILTWASIRNILFNMIRCFWHENRCFWHNPALNSRVFLT